MSSGRSEKKYVTVRIELSPWVSRVFLFPDDWAEDIDDILSVLLAKANDDGTRVPLSAISESLRDGAP